jgi:dolichol-phosphate mannosyltransferase
MDDISPAGKRFTVDVIVPVFNERDAIITFHDQLRQVIDPLSYRFNIHYIDDGSDDGTHEVLRNIASADERVVILELSRNFGQQAALTAGLDQADGDFVITMDGDGQHPPSLIPDMIHQAELGYDVVLAERYEEKVPLFKSRTSSFFYFLINKMGDTQINRGSADYRLLTHRVVESFRTMREYHRLVRGMVAWMGYKTVILPYKQPERIAGETKYSLKQLLRLATHAIFSFSLVPLYLGISVGLIFIILALAEMVYVLSFWVTGNIEGLAPGWSSLMFVLLIVGGSLMVTLGFIGIYVGFIFQEVKRRPIYFIRRRWTNKDQEQVTDYLETDPPPDG